jgi:uncharacterized membrane protein YraQ (UPF0718 family)
MAASPPHSTARGKKGTAMLIPTLIMAALALLFFVLAYRRGGGQHIAGMRMAWTTLIETLPLLVFSFIVAGLVQVLLPRDLVSRWVGTESGARGLLIGTVAGALTPGGPYVSFPVIAGLLNAGAGVGTMVAFLSGWSLWAFSRLPLEVGIVGWRFTLIRLASTFFFPPLAGLLAQALTRLIR